MIVPFDDIAGKTRAELLDGYLGLGFDQETAEAYVDVLLDGDDPGLNDFQTPVAKNTLTMSVDKALQLGAGHPDFEQAIRKLVDDGVDRVQVTYNEDTDEVSVDKPTGVMVAIMLDDLYPSLSFPGGETDPHITLCYLGKEADLSLNDKRQLVGVVNEVASRHTTLHGVIGGTGYFEQSGAWYARPFIPGLMELRQDMFDSLVAAGLPVDTTYEDYTPHVTLAYTDKVPDVDVSPFDVYVNRVSAVVGGYRADAPLPPMPAEDFASLAPAGHQTTPFVPIVKSVAEKRFTLAPVYIPGQYDAHGDWSTDDDIQKAVWDFNRGDRLIALQHHPEFGPVGECVELMTVPWEMDVPMQKSDGTTEVVHFPANTPWMGVVWGEEVWPLVKSGAVNGYSIGGRASMLDVDLPGAEKVLKARE